MKLASLSSRTTGFPLATGLLGLWGWGQEKEKLHPSQCCPAVAGPGRHVAGQWLPLQGLLQVPKPLAATCQECVGSRWSLRGRSGPGVGAAETLLSPFLRSYKGFFPILKLPLPSSLSPGSPTCQACLRGSCALLALRGADLACRCVCTPWGPSAHSVCLDGW